MKKYNIKEWNNLFEELKIALPRPYLQIDNRFENLIKISATARQSYRFTIEALIALNEILTTAHYCLLEGCKSYPQMNSRESNAQYIINFHNLKSAIVWYNSAIDYLLQTIYWGFGFNSEINNQDEFDANLRMCRKSDISQEGGHIDSEFFRKLKDQAKINDKIKTIYNSYNRIASGSEANEIRKWANAMKHHWGVNLEESYIAPTRVSYSKLGIPGPDTPPIDRSTASPLEIIKHYINEAELEYIPQKTIVKYQYLVCNLVNLHINLIDFQGDLHETFVK